MRSVELNPALFTAAGSCVPSSFVTPSPGRFLGMRPPPRCAWSPFPVPLTLHWGRISPAPLYPPLRSGAERARGTARRAVEGAAPSPLGNARRRRQADPSFLQGFPIAVLSLFKEFEGSHTHFHFWPSAATGGRFCSRRRLRLPATGPVARRDPSLMWIRIPESNLFNALLRHLPTARQILPSDDRVRRGRSSAGRLFRTGLRRGSSRTLIRTAPSLIPRDVSPLRLGARPLGQAPVPSRLAKRDPKQSIAEIPALVHCLFRPGSEGAGEAGDFPAAARSSELSGSVASIRKDDWPLAPRLGFP